MKLIFFANKNKPNVVDLMQELRAAARNRGISSVAVNSEELLDVLAPNIWEEAFCIVTVGGDGTILRAASAASRFGKHVLGVNLGRIGFFSEIGVNEFEKALDKLIAEDFTVERASMLSCELNGENMGDCLNDFVLHRQELSSITHLALEVDGFDIGEVMADGLIVSTPSGSTAYTMSAGGPVVAPKLDCILVTPICPHSLTVRPIVASKDSRIRARLKSPCRLTGDGIGLRLLNPGDELSFFRSERTAQFIRFENRNVFKLIREKLK